MSTCFWIYSSLILTLLMARCLGQDPATSELAPDAAILDQAAKFQPLPPMGSDWTSLTKKDSPQQAWVNGKARQIAVAGEVCLTKGYLEMFACIENTKEHESVVALKAKASLLHGALLAVGAKNGQPAQWRPYRPASGTTIEVFVEWMHDGKPRRVKAQQWVRDLKTKEAMAHDWVFAGSSIYTDPETRKNYYRADGGEVICVSNFPVAMLDLPIQSSQSDDELAFEAFTENIPPRGTPVRVYLVPKLPEKNDGPKRRSTE